MQTSIHQNLNVNSFSTEKVGFSSELYLQGLILQNPSLLSFSENSDPQILFNEFRLSRNNGRIDLIIGVDNQIGIVELKNVCITRADAEKQLMNYLDEQNAKEIYEELDINKSERDAYFGVIVGPTIDEDAIVCIQEHNEIKSNIPIYVILLNQFKTDNDQIFCLSTVLIRPKPKNDARDFTKYKFLGKTYGKGRLVLAVVNHLIKTENPRSFKDLKKWFDQRIQGSFELIIEADKIRNNEKDSKRYFVNDPIELASGELVLVTSQWGSGNINKFLEHNLVKPLDIIVLKIN